MYFIDFAAAAADYQSTDDSNCRTLDALDSLDHNEP